MNTIYIHDASDERLIIEHVNDVDEETAIEICNREQMRFNDCEC